jgi:hypothetical protein
MHLRIQIDAPATDVACVSEEDSHGTAAESDPVEEGVERRAGRGRAAPARAKGRVMERACEKRSGSLRHMRGPVQRDEAAERCNEDEDEASHEPAPMLAPSSLPDHHLEIDEIGSRTWDCFCA